MQMIQLRFTSVQASSTAGTISSNKCMASHRRMPWPGVSLKAVFLALQKTLRSASLQRAWIYDR